MRPGALLPRTTSSASLPGPPMRDGVPGRAYAGRASVYLGRAYAGRGHGVLGRLGQSCRALWGGDRAAAEPGQAESGQLSGIGGQEEADG